MDFQEERSHGGPFRTIWSHERLKAGSTQLHMHLVHLVLPLSIYLDFCWEWRWLEAVGPNHMACLWNSCAWRMIHIVFIIKWNLNFIVKPMLLGYKCHYFPCQFFHICLHAISAICYGLYYILITNLLFSTAHSKGGPENSPKKQNQNEKKR